MRPAIDHQVDNRDFSVRFERWTYGYSWDTGTWDWHWAPAVFETNGSAPAGGSYTSEKLSAAVRNQKNESGWRNPSPLSGERVVTEYRPIAFGELPAHPSGWTSVDIIQRAGWAGFVYGHKPLEPVFETDALVGQARTAALSRFRNMTVDLSVAFMERKKTASLAADTMDGFSRLWRSLRRRNPKRSLDEIGNLWLSYRYGWTPAVSDVYGALEAIERLDNGHYDRYRVTQRGFARDNFTTRHEGLGSCESGNKAFYYANAVHNTDARVNVKCRLDALLTQASYLRLQEVGVTDPASTAWELLPYSFVVDWFAGVGDYLSAVNALDAYQFQSESLTVAREWNTTILWDEKDLAVSQDGFRFERTVSFTPPPASIELQREPLDLTRFFDALALLNGLMKGTRR